MLVSERRAAALRRARRHHRTARRCAGRRALRDMGRARRSGDRVQAHAQPARLPRRAGIARDLAAAGLGQAPRKRSSRWGAGACPRRSRSISARRRRLPGLRAARLVRGVKNGPSPEWLQQRLRAIGLRPINALVDITNYITYDRARPLHVFDAAKVKGSSCGARARREAARARRQDLHARRHDVRDRRRRRARVARRRHGRRSHRLRRDTTDVLIESAHFDPLHMAQTGRHSASTPTRATASSAASIRPSSCPGSSWRPGWCSISAAARRRRSPSPAIRRCRSWSSTSRFRGEAPRRPRRAARKCAASSRGSASRSPGRTST